MYAIGSNLTQAERDELTALLSGGKHAARKLKRAQILLAADAGASDEDDREERRRRRLDRLPDQAPLCARQPCGGAQRRAASGREPQALRQRGSPAGRDRLFEPARGPRPLDPGTVGW